MNKFNKHILFLLIIPVFCELIFIALGTILNGWEVKWINILIFFTVLVVSAVAMSKNGSTVINTMGFLMFSSVGVFFIITYFDIPARVRSAYPKGELYFGISTVVLAIILYIYSILKNTNRLRKK